MIDKIGLDNFKDIYSKNTIEIDLKRKYGYTLKQLIDEFKEEIKG